jgi:hypothetical protein
MKGLILILSQLLLFSMQANAQVAMHHGWFKYEDTGELVNCSTGSVIRGITVWTALPGICDDDVAGRECGGRVVELSEHCRDESRSFFQNGTASAGEVKGLFRVCYLDSPGYTCPLNKAVRTGLYRQQSSYSGPANLFDGTLFGNAFTVRTFRQNLTAKSFKLPDQTIVNGKEYRSAKFHTTGDGANPYSPKFNCGPLPTSPETESDTLCQFAASGFLMN